MRVGLLRSPPHPCPYLEGELATSDFIDPQTPLTAKTYANLVAMGFRRSGNHVYRPACQECRACRSVRVPVADFRPRRSQRRAEQRSADLGLVARPGELVDEHYELYKRYTASRHPDGDMAEADQAEYMRFLASDWCETLFLEMRLGERLLGVAVTDVLPDALSAVYTFFDPDEGDRSPGVLGILSQLALCRRLGKPWLYLGYWVRDSQKMGYKTDYRPIEVLTEGNWQRFETGEDILIAELEKVETVL